MIEQPTFSESPRKEIAEWLKDHPENPHTPEIKMSDLTEKDFTAWQKAKNGTITWQDVADYRNNIIKETEHVEDSVKKSRLAFQAIFADIVQILILNRGGKLEN